MGGDETGRRADYDGRGSGSGVQGAAFHQRGDPLGAALVSGLSDRYRDLAAMLSDRGVPVDHSTLFRWVQAYAARLEQRVRRVLSAVAPALLAIPGRDSYALAAEEDEARCRSRITTSSPSLTTNPVPRTAGAMVIQVPGAHPAALSSAQALNPPGERWVERFGWTFCPGDKVMQVVNDCDRDVFNGDLGVITRVDTEEGELGVSFDGREVSYGFGKLDELVLAYATTIHKAQGSEYPAVVIPLSTQHYAMLARNLLYTGLTRGKRLVVLVGQRKALAIAVRNQGARKRWSRLREWLGGRRVQTGEPVFRSAMPRPRRI